MQPLASAMILAAPPAIPVPAETTVPPNTVLLGVRATQMRPAMAGWPGGAAVQGGATGRLRLLV
jgi:hypothetical protein